MLAVIYGLPEKFSTTIQIKELTKRLRFEKKEIMPRAWSNVFFKLAAIAANIISSIMTVKNGDTVYASAPLIASSLPAILLKKIKGVELVVEWGDAFEDFTKKKPKPWNIKYFEYLAVKTADKVVVVSDKLYKITSEIRGSGKSVFSIPYGVDTDFFDPEKYDRDVIREKYNLRNEILIGVTGYIGKYKGIFAYREIAEVSIQILKKYNNVRFIIVGFGPGLNDFIKFTKKNGIENKFIFTNYVKYSEMPYYIAAMDICLVPFGNDFTSYTRSSCKIKEFMSMEKAIVTMRAGESVKYMDNGRAGLLSDFDIAIFEKCIVKLIEDEKMRKKLGKAARKRAVKYYDFGVLSKQLARVLSVP
ncbi:MAG: glycosyltransferase [Candidatus Aenigmarchaeota archaeon]|nr:glycosyltransferase [Candidatus Aenigmarchaeota archaeon]